MADFAATGSRFLRPFQLGLLAEQYGRIGNVDGGLTPHRRGTRHRRPDERTLVPSPNSTGARATAREDASDDAEAEAALPACDRSRRGTRAPGRSKLGRGHGWWPCWTARADTLKPRPSPTPPDLTLSLTAARPLASGRRPPASHRETRPWRLAMALDDPGRSGQHDPGRGASRTLAAALRGELIQPGDAAYDAARRVHNGMIDRYPRLIARCRDVADVMASVAFGREHGLLDRRPQRRPQRGRSRDASTTAWSSTSRR